VYSYQKQLLPLFHIDVQLDVIFLDTDRYVKENDIKIMINDLDLGINVHEFILFRDKNFCKDTQNDLVVRFKITMAFQSKDF